MAQVLMPQQRESDLDQILKGLQIAGGIYGLYTNTKDLELKKAQMEQLSAEKEATKAETARKQASILNEGELNELADTGHVFYDTAPQGIEGLRPRSVLLPDGAQKTVYQDTIANQKKRSDAASAQAAIVKDNTNRSDKLADDDKKYLLEAKKEFNPANNQVVRDSVNKHNSAVQLEWLLSQKKANLDAIAARQVFDISGDVGAFRTEDFTQFGTSPSLRDQAVLTYNRLVNGQPINDAERKNLMDFAGYVKAKNKTQLNKIASQQAKDYASVIRGMKQDDLLEELNPSGYLQQGGEIMNEMGMSSGGSGISSRGLPGETNAYAAPGPFDQVPLDAIEAELQRRQKGGR